MARSKRHNATAGTDAPGQQRATSNESLTGEQAHAIAQQRAPAAFSKLGGSEASIVTFERRSRQHVTATSCVRPSAAVPSLPVTHTIGYKTQTPAQNETSERPTALTSHIHLHINPHIHPQVSSSPPGIPTRKILARDAGSRWRTSCGKARARPSARPASVRAARRGHAALPAVKMTRFRTARPLGDRMTRPKMSKMMTKKRTPKNHHTYLQTSHVTHTSQVA